MDKNIDMALFRSKVSDCCCFDPWPYNKIKEQVYLLNTFLPEEYQLTTDEMDRFIIVYKLYREWLMEKFLSKDFTFSNNFLSYSAVRRSKEYSLKTMEEHFGNGVEGRLFFFQTIQRFFHDTENCTEFFELEIFDSEDKLTDIGIVVYKMLLGSLLALESINIINNSYESNGARNLLRKTITRNYHRDLEANL